MSKKTALIAGGSALGGALLVGLVILVLALTGDDDSTSDPAVKQVDIAAGSAQLSRDLGEIAESIADGRSGGKAGGAATDDATDLLADIATLDQEALAAPSLKRANDANLDAATELEGIAAAIERGRNAMEEDQEASEEASQELAGFSGEVEGLAGPIGRAAKRANVGLIQLQQAIAAISAGVEDEDDADISARLRTVEGSLQLQRRSLKSAFDSLGSVAESLSDELAGRSEELKPDIVLDCPELNARGAGLYDVSVRNISCAEAAGLLGEFGPPTGFACTELESGYEFTEYRCVRGDQAIRYGVGA